MSDSDDESGKKATKDAAKARPAKPSRRRPSRPEPTETSEASSIGEPNPVWWVPVMVGLMVVGLLWLVACYLTQTDFPVPGIGNWNLVVGFAMIMGGFLMTTRWR